MRLLLLSVVTLIVMLFVVFMLPPTFAIDLGGMKVSVTPFLFFFTGIFVFSVVTSIFGNAKHGILASLFVLIYFWLRLNKLFHPMFTLLLVALFLTLELLFSAKKEH